MMRASRTFAWSAMLVLLPAVALAQASEEVVLTSTTANSQGRIAVNVASGNGNQQASSAVIAVGTTGIGSNGVDQHSSSRNSLTGPTHAEIQAGALSGLQGMISINVAAGNDNQEANLAVVALALGGSALTNTMLSQTRAEAPQKVGQDAPSRGADSAMLSPDALTGSHGLIQINLVAGERNSSANTFALNVSGGGN
ncbi:hypothetical protein [Sphingomonas xanthus]|uniref:Uncharacterized protein n=1 Tax=Sphingomonas xanthus TaxID=2594473 RepID=A0A516INL3_9SPHN|nr:hypothetical protein [Sphingomonas xanthus]QDP18495.1 hypothetical protein FMM02_00085 [Sphingomonas xanthus]